LRTSLVKIREQMRHGRKMALYVPVTPAGLETQLQVWLRAKRPGPLAGKLRALLHKRWR